jgi:hypothetical protein
LAGFGFLGWLWLSPRDYEYRVTMEVRPDPQGFAYPIYGWEAALFIAVAALIVFLIRRRKQ